MNPFSDYGQLASGARFIGRSRELQHIKARVFGGTELASIALVGETRIGKTSLMYKAIDDSCDEINRLNVVVIDLGSVGRMEVGAKAFFVHMCLTLEAEMPKIGSYKSSWNHDCINEHNFLNTHLFNYFWNIKKQGFRVLFLLDEFDSVVRIFSDMPESAYQILREIIVSHKTSGSFAFIFATRLSMSEIENTPGCNSRFANVVQDRFIGLMTLEDIESLIESRVRDGDIGFESGETDWIIEQAGQHSYFVQILGFYLYQNKERNLRSGNLFKCTLEEARDEVHKTFSHYQYRVGMTGFDLILAIFKDKQPHHQKIFTDRLVNSGLFVKERGNKLTPFSKMYSGFLQDHIDVANSNASLFRR